MGKKKNTGWSQDSSQRIPSLSEMGSKIMSDRILPNGCFPGNGTLELFLLGTVMKPTLAVGRVLTCALTNTMTTLLEAALQARPQPGQWHRLQHSSVSNAPKRQSAALRWLESREKTQCLATWIDYIFLRNIPQTLFIRTEKTRVY